MDNLEQIAKLGKLKEKGFISEEEFLKQKEELLNQEKRGVSWGNVVLSFFIMIGIIIVYFVLLAVFLYFDVFDVLSYSRYLVINALLAGIFALLAKKFETSKYQWCAPICGIVLATMIFPMYAAWIFSYQLLQIKQKKAVLK